MADWDGYAILDTRDKMNPTHPDDSQFYDQRQTA